MLVTRVDVVVIAVLVVMVGVVCYTIGLFVRRASDQDLIADLYKELDARRAEMPPEIAHEPRGYLEVPDWQMPPVQLGTPIRNVGMIYQDPVEEHARTSELREARADGWDLDAWVADLLAAHPVGPDGDQ